MLSQALKKTDDLYEERQDAIKFVPKLLKHYNDNKPILFEPFVAKRRLCALFPHKHLEIKGIKTHIIA